MAAAGASARALGKDFTSLSETQAAAFTSIGIGATALGAGIVVGFGLAAKAAIDFESSFAGVRKTVEATEPQFAILQQGLRDMAKELPVNVNELNRIAEAAGQLGIKREAILGFTKTVAAMGVTTDLTSEQAANAFARIGNIMGTSQDDFDRMGSTIVELGNKGAATESEITEMALRIAGAGNQIGLTEAQVLGFSEALSSVGINAEAGGSAISRTFIKIAESVDEGGDKLDTFAEVAGMSAGEFTRLFQEDAAGATVAFIEGLDRISQSGGSVFKVLDELGLSEIRVRDALLRASGAGDLFRQSLETGTQAWLENTALTEEAAKRYDTTASRIQLAKNRLNDFAISMGQVLLPAIAKVADLFGAFIDIVDGLPKPLKAVAFALTGIVGAASLLGGGLLIAIGQINKYRIAIQTAGTSAVTFGGALKSMGSFLAGPWGLALTAATVGLGFWISSQQKARDAARAYAATLDEQTGAFTENTAALVANRLEEEGILRLARQAGIDIDLVTRAILGEKDAVEELNAALVAPGARNIEERGALLRAINAETGAVKGSIEVWADKKAAADAAAEALGGTAGAAENTGGAMGDLEGPIEDVTDAFEEQKTSARDLWLEHLQLAGGFLGLQAAALSNRDAERELAAARRTLIDLEEKGKKGTEKYKEARRDYESALIDATQSELDMAAAVAEYILEEKGGEVTRKDAIKATRDAGDAAGLTKRETEGLVDQVLVLIDKYGKVPKRVSTTVQAHGVSNAADEAKRLYDNLKGITGMGTIRAEVQVSGPSGGDIAMAAGGGSPTGMFNYLQAIVPGAQSISSGYRPGDKDSYHSLPGGMHAVDIVGANLTTAYNVAKATFGAGIREMILDHSIYQRGVEGYYAPSDHTGSNRHLHLADQGGFFKGPGMLEMGPGIEYFASGILGGTPGKAWWDQFNAGGKTSGGSKREKLADEIADMLTRALHASLKRRFDLLGKVLDELSGFITDKLEKDQREHIQQRIRHFADLTEVFQDQSEQLRAEFDRLKAKMQELRSSVKGAIKGFVDITAIDLGAIPEGSNVAEVVALQIQEAEGFAKTIRQLAKLGLNTQMLQQIIQTQDLDLANAILAGGQQMVKDLNNAQKDINQLAQDTASFVADKVFGEKLEKVEKQFDRLGNRLERLIGNIEDFANRMGSLDIGKAKKAASGFHGDVTSPTLFLAGEGGRERVDISPVPHGRLTPLGPGVPGAGSTASFSDRDLDRIGRAIGKSVALSGSLTMVMEDGTRFKVWVQDAAFDGFRQAARAQGTR